MERVCSSCWTINENLLISLCWKKNSLEYRWKPCITIACVTHSLIGWIREMRNGRLKINDSPMNVATTKTNRKHISEQEKIDPQCNLVCQTATICTVIRTGIIQCQKAEHLTVWQFGHFSIGTVKMTCHTLLAKCLKCKSLASMSIFYQPPSTNSSIKSLTRHVHFTFTSAIWLPQLARLILWGLRAFSDYNYWIHSKLWVPYMEIIADQLIIIIKYLIENIQLSWQLITNVPLT